MQVLNELWQAFALGFYVHFSMELPLSDDDNMYGTT